MVEEGIGHIDKPDIFLDNQDVVRSTGLREQIREILPVLRRDGIGLHGTPKKNVSSIEKHGLDPTRTGRKQPEIFYYVYRPKSNDYNDKELATRFLGSVRGAVIWAISHSDFEQAYWLWRESKQTRKLNQEMPVVTIFRPPLAIFTNDDLDKITFPIESLNTVIHPRSNTQVTVLDLKRIVSDAGEGFYDFQERLAVEFAGKVVQGLATKRSV